MSFNLFASLSALAGYRPEYVRRMSQDDQTMHGLMGLIIMIPVLSAFFGALHTIHDHTQNMLSGLFGAFVWSGIVYIIELGMLKLIKATGWVKLIVIPVRILMSLSLSLILAITFIIMFFNASIKQKLNDKKMADIQAIEVKFENQTDSLRREIAAADSSIQNLSHQLRFEMLDNGGVGPRFRFLQTSIDSARTRQRDLTTLYQPVINALDSTRNAQISSVEHYYAGDFIAKVKTLWEMRADPIVAFTTILFLMILLILDLCPLLMKNLSPLSDTNSAHNVFAKKDSENKIQSGLSELDKQAKYDEFQNKVALTEMQMKQRGNNILDEYKGDARNVLSILNAQQEYIRFAEEEFANEEALKAQAIAFIKRLTQVKLKQASGAAGLEKFDFISTPDNHLIYVGNESDFEKHHPFAVNGSIASLVQQVVEGKESEEERFNAIFDWVQENIPYNKHHDGISYKSAQLTFDTRTGICGEQSALLVAMLRLAGFKAFYVSVTKDDKTPPQEVHHACCGVYIKGVLQLADVAYQNRNVFHQVFQIEKDADVLSKFQAWNKI